MCFCIDETWMLLEPFRLKRPSHCLWMESTPEHKSRLIHRTADTQRDKDDTCGMEVQSRASVGTDDQARAGTRSFPPAWGQVPPLNRGEKNVCGTQLPTQRRVDSNFWVGRAKSWSRNSTNCGVSLYSDFMAPPPPPPPQNSVYYLLWQHQILLVHLQMFFT